jgi:hypothetical protein
MSLIAKYSGSVIVGALKKTPTLMLAISSSLMNKVDGVKYGVSELAGYFKYVKDNYLIYFKKIIY